MKRHSIGLSLLALASLAAYGQSVLPEWLQHLSRAKLQAKENFDRIPNYVCRETIDRSQKSPGHAFAKKLDSLRFDVAEVGHKEMLAMPGGSFNEKDPAALISSGIIGTGAFAALPFNIFMSTIVRIQPHGEEPFSFDFILPAQKDGVEIAANGSRSPVEERGTFWVNPDTLDLMRIESTIIDPPMWSGMKEVHSTANYGRVRIGVYDVVLTQSAELVVLNWDGNEMRNQIKFSDCREYTAESTIKFGDTATLPPPPKKQ